jgi:predicted dinucleotide-binding enzyme
MDTVNYYPQRDGRVAELDDVAAKEAVVSFLDDIGYDAVDAGPLGEAVRYRDMTD